MDKAKIAANKTGGGPRGFRNYRPGQPVPRKPQRPQPRPGDPSYIPPEVRNKRDLPN